MEFQKQSMILAFALALGAAGAARADDPRLPPAEDMDKGVDDVDVDVNIDTKGEHKSAAVAVDTDNAALKNKASKLGKVDVDSLTKLIHTVRGVGFVVQENEP